jgi:hypothetical protein
MWKPKVGRHVTFHTASGKPRSGTITTVTNATTLNLRVGHTGGTATGSTKRTSGARAGKWRPTA